MFVHRSILFLLYSLLVSLPLVAAGPPAHWEPVPLESLTGDYRDVVLLDYRTRWLLDQTGKVVQADGRMQKIPPGGQSLFFLNELQGWIVGEQGLVLHTENAGHDWQYQPIASEITLEDVYFRTVHDGWAVGHQEGAGILLRTEDDGQQWQQVPSEDLPRLRAIAFSGSIGWAAGDRGTLLLTTDWGRSWKRRYPPTGADLRGIGFAPTGEAWFVGSAGTVLSTPDRGEHWFRYDALLGADWNDVAFSDARQGAIVGSGGRLLLTNNGGKTWYEQPTETTADLHALSLVEGTQGWAVGGEGAVVNTTTGTQRRPRANRNMQSLPTQLCFVDPSHGWVVGTRGDIWGTSDGGITWIRQPSPVEQFLSSVYFIDRESGWAVGADGLILHTADAGQQWYVQRMVASEYLSDVYFSDSLSGWAVGHDGLLLRTQNSGRSWNRQLMDVRYDLAAISFASPQSGWIVGRTLQSPASAVALATSDGGVTWQDRTGDFAGVPPLWDLSFRREHPNAVAYEGILVGDGGTILQTHDGGQSWYWTRGPTSLSLHAVTYSPSGTIWVGGQSGLILEQQADGWQIQELPTKRAIDGLTVTSETVWAVGGRPAIWKRIDSPSVSPVNAMVTSAEMVTSTDSATPEVDAAPETGGVDLIAASIQDTASFADVPVLESQEPPAPRFLWILIPEQAQLGVPFEVDVGVINTGGFADRGTLSISLPESPRFLVVDHDTTDTATYPSGGAVWSSATGEMIPAQHPLIEAVQEGWHSQEAHALKIRILPTRRGTLRIRIRAALKVEGAPPALIPQVGNHDQQGFPVRQYEIAVQ